MEDRLNPPCSGIAEEVHNLYEEFKSWHDKAIDFNYRVGALLNSPKLRDGLTEAELTDVGAHIKSMSKHLDEVRRELDAREKLLARILCSKIGNRILSDATLEPKAIGYYATAVATPKKVPLLPSRDSEDYKTLLKQLGVTGRHLDTKTVNIHFPNLAKWIGEMEASGKPTGLKVKVGTEGACRYRFKNREDKDGQSEEE